jgi:hypothetical protein
MTDKTRTIEISEETYEQLMERGQFPETMDQLIVRLANGVPKTQRIVTIVKPKVKRKRKRHKIGCKYCDRVFLAAQGYASHLRCYHPEHYHPANPTPLSERTTVRFRNRKEETEKADEE